MRDDRGQAELAAIYRDLEALASGGSCPRSTTCCRFAKTGRRPYLWPVEARRVLAALGRRGGRLPGEAEEGDCPLLLRGGGCAVYADRPFGCRTFFCDDATLPPSFRKREVDALAARLKALSERLGEGDVAPLTSWLARAADRQGRLRVVR